MAGDTLAGVSMQSSDIAYDGVSSNPRAESRGENQAASNEISCLPFGSGLLDQPSTSPVTVGVESQMSLGSNLFSFVDEKTRLPLYMLQEPAPFVRLFSCIKFNGIILKSGESVLLEAASGLIDDQKEAVFLACGHLLGQRSVLLFDQNGSLLLQDPLVVRLNRRDGPKMDTSATLLADFLANLVRQQKGRLSSFPSIHDSFFPKAGEWKPGHVKRILSKPAVRRLSLEGELDGPRWQAAPKVSDGYQEVEALSSDSSDPSNNPETLPRQPPKRRKRKSRSASPSTRTSWESEVAQVINGLVGGMGARSVNIEHLHIHLSEKKK